MGSLTFYFDRTFGKRFPEALNKMSPPVRIKWHQEQKFKPNLEDDKWLKIVGQRGWAVFSQDRKFHKQELELAAIKQFKVGCFYFPCASQKKWESVTMFVRKFNRLCYLYELQKKPFIYNIYTDGRMRKVL